MIFRSDLSFNQKVAEYVAAEYAKSNVNSDFLLLSLNMSLQSMQKET